MYYRLKQKDLRLVDLLGQWLIVSMYSDNANDDLAMDILKVSSLFCRLMLIMHLSSS